MDLGRGRYDTLSGHVAQLSPSGSLRNDPRLIWTEEMVAVDPWFWKVTKISKAFAAESRRLWDNGAVRDDHGLARFVETSARAYVGLQYIRHHGRHAAGTAARLLRKMDEGSAALGIHGQIIRRAGEIARTEARWLE